MLENFRKSISAAVDTKHDEVSPQNLTQYFAEHPSLLAIPQEEIENLSPVKAEQSNRSINLSKLISEVETESKPPQTPAANNETMREENPLSLTDLIAENEKAMEDAANQGPQSKIDSPEKKSTINVSDLLNENPSFNQSVDTIMHSLNSKK